MDLQRAALNALEPFLALSKSATSPRAAADLVTQATSAPNTFVFAELLQTPNIQALRNSEEHAGSLKLLEIFAWGTLEDYLATPSLPHLNSSQQSKLRLLSLLPLLTTRPSEFTHADAEDTAAAESSPGYQLTYPYLIKHLSLDEVSSTENGPTDPTDGNSLPTPNQTLESLLAAALPLSLLSGHIDPLHSRLSISSVAPLRDPPPNSIPVMTSKLTSWETRCNSTISEIETQINTVKAQALKRAEIEEQRRKEMDNAIEDAEREARDSAMVEVSAAEERAGRYGGGGGYYPFVGMEHGGYGVSRGGGGGGYIGDAARTGIPGERRGPGVSAPQPRQTQNQPGNVAPMIPPRGGPGQGPGSMSVMPEPFASGPPETPGPSLPGLGAAPAGPPRGTAPSAGSNKRPAPSGSTSSANDNDNEGEGVMDADVGVSAPFGQDGAGSGSGRGSSGGGGGGGGAAGGGGSAEKKGAKKVFSESSSGSGGGGGEGGGGSGARS